MDIKLTRKFPTKDGIYMVQWDDNNPFLAEILTDEFPDITVTPIPNYDHNDAFCVTKGNKRFRCCGPIKFK